jgi:restriction system protein
MTMDAVFHYPPDVFEAVVDAVPLLTRSRSNVVLFFRGCGVDRVFLADIERRLEADPGFKKYHIARTILAHVNDLGDSGLRQRREILKRVSEFDDFLSCYSDNQLKARGAVATVAQLINKKDSFTRLQDERERELQQHREARRAEAAAKEAKRAQREALKADLFALFGDQNPHRRGKALEGVLNRLFKAEEILIREAFEVRDDSVGGGTIEQILLVSNSPYQPSAVADCKDALTKKTVVLVELREIVQALTDDRSVRDLLTKKIHAATLFKDPLVYPLDQLIGT